MATFVLIPGGWRGGWTFADFVARLNSAGHHAYAVTLSGLGDCPDGLADINLETHIADVIRMLTTEDLSDVILCSHSYGGMVATGVADREPRRIAALAYLDAFAPEDGQSWWDLANRKAPTANTPPNSAIASIARGALSSRIVRLPRVQTIRMSGSSVRPVSTLERNHACQTAANPAE